MLKKLSPNIDKERICIDKGSPYIDKGNQNIDKKDCISK